MPPNLIMIVMDTARADAFEPYGAEPGCTPTIAQLASRGTALPAVFAPASWTVPSHVSLFSGLLPRAVGLAQAPSGTPTSCRPVVEALGPRLLPEVLRGVGYETVGVSTNLWISEQSGFATGFDEFHSISTGRNHRINDASLRGRFAWDLEGVRARVDDGATEAEEVLMRRLASASKQPFFWFVNLTECHSPYLPPRPYNDLSVWQRLRAAEDARRHLNLVAIWRASLGNYTIGDEVVDRMRHLYKRSVRAMDDWLARLLDALDCGGILDDTIVMVTSDHGENLGENGLMGHAFSLDDRLLRVPLVVSERSGFEDRSLSSLVDLPGILAEALGVDDHPWREAAAPRGVALAQLDALAPPTDPRVSSFIADWGLGDEAFRRLTTPMTCATDGRLKLLRRGREELLYDLAIDPFEAQPTAVSRLLPEQDAPSVATLRAAIEDIDDAEVELSAAERAGGDGVRSGETDALADQMRLLGYL